MKIISTRKSIEQCTESGWEAFDFMVESPLTDDDVRGLRVIGGSFLYMSRLKTPFFKIESHNYVIKGVKGGDHFRMAVHKDYLSEVERVKELFKVLN